jgi:hypothetical protein
MGAFMKLDRRKLSGREKDARAIKLLAQLRDKLYSQHVPVARRAAFNLSWMQEDGLDILKEALFSNAGRRTKSAAAYGLRKMRGRMTEPAVEVLSEGLADSDRMTAEVCENALSILQNGVPAKPAPPPRAKTGRFEIRGIAQRRTQRRPRELVGRPRSRFTR